MLNLIIFPLLRYRSPMGDFSMNKSTEVTPRMQVVLLNKSIGVPAFESTTEWKSQGQTM